MSLLAAALMGGQVFAGVVFTGDAYNDEYCIAGAHTDDDSMATGGNLVVSYAEQGGLYGDELFVSGGETEEGGSVHGNTVTMTGGQVTGLYGGYIWYGGSSDDVTDNTVNLVGVGATVNINGTTYVGQEVGIKADHIYGGIYDSSNAASRNTINIYGTHIETRVVAGFDQLNINLVNRDEVVLTLGDGVDLGSVELSFGTLDTTIDFDTITLINVERVGQTIALSAEQLAKTWDITDTNGVVITTGTLSLENDNKTLKMNFTTATPEPATATLSLLALAGLASRRRRK